VKDPFAHSTSLATGVLFAAFLFIGYVMLYGLTHLPRMQRLEVLTEGEMLETKRLARV
jgi:hypothetical protein